MKKVVVLQLFLNVLVVLIMVMYMLGLVSLWMFCIGRQVIVCLFGLFLSVQWLVQIELVMLVRVCLLWLLFGLQVLQVQGLWFSLQLLWWLLCGQEQNRFDSVFLCMWKNFMLVLCMFIEISGRLCVLCVGSMLLCEVKFIVLGRLFEQMLCLIVWLSVCLFVVSRLGLIVMVQWVFGVMQGKFSVVLLLFRFQLLFIGLLEGLVIVSMLLKVCVEVSLVLNIRLSWVWLLCIEELFDISMKLVLLLVCVVVEDLVGVFCSVGLLFL